MKKGLGFLFVALVVLVIVVCVSADGFDKDDQEGLTQVTDLLPRKMLTVSGEGDDAEKSIKMNQRGLLEGKFSSSTVLDHGGSHGYGIVKNGDDDDDDDDKDDDDHGHDDDDSDDDDNDGEDDDKKAANVHDHDHDHHHGHDGSSDTDDDEYKHVHGHA